MFTADVDTVCKAANHVVRVPFRRYVAAEQHYLTTLKMLTAPRSEQAIYAKFLATFQTAINDFRDQHGSLPLAVAVIQNRALRHKLHAPPCGF